MIMRMTRRWVLAAAVLGLVAGAQGGARADVTVSFDFSTGPTVVAAGQFSFDETLDGTILGYSDLSSFDFTIVGGSTYDLAFLNSGSFSGYYHFQFDSASDTLIPTVILGFPTLFAAIKADFESGFFVGTPDENPAVADYVPTPERTEIYTSMSLTRQTAAIPEPSSVALTGLTALVGLGVAWRRRNRASA
jgi:hypothetical protein